jgi:hypothetical protein
VRQRLGVGQRRRGLAPADEHGLKAKQCGGAQSKESTLLYVLSHTAPHTNLHINKSTEA